jgi:hypothetical protein
MVDRRDLIRMVGAVILFAVVGCKPKAQTTAPAGAAPSEEATALVKIMTQGMEAVSLAGLTQDHVGRSCVVVARTPEQTAPADAPPPLGMVRILGTTTLYRGQIHGVSPEGLQVHAAYPNSGRLKIISIPAASVQSIHIGK